MLDKVNYVMVIVWDMKRSVAFYRDLLGIPLKFESPDWTPYVSIPELRRLRSAAGKAGHRTEAG